MAAPVQQAAVIGIFFPADGKTLILDFRAERSGTPRVIVEEAAASPQELLALIRRHHGSRGAIAEFTYLPWRGTLAEFVAQGLLRAVADRLTTFGEADSAMVVDAAWRKITAM